MRKYLSTLIILLLVMASFYTTYAKRSNRTRRVKPAPAVLNMNTDSVSADGIMQFAESLMGTRYRPATSDPAIGFDCSGFVSYVFKSFNVSVPRSSCQFINIGEKIRLEDAKPGDIILFTSPKKHSHRIGHVGIVYCNTGDQFEFIHSTSGKEHGVTITAMDDTYRHRFVQIIRVLKQNGV